MLKQQRVGVLLKFEIRCWVFSVRRSSSLNFARPPDRAPWLRAGVLAVLQNLHAIHEHMLHPHRILMRFFKSGAIANRGGIEDDHVGKHSFLDEADAG